MKTEGNPILCEIFIKDNELTKEQRFTIIRGIYDKILYDDPLWHFFYEEEVGDIIRCSPDNLASIRLLLDECGFDYTWSDNWKETIEAVINNPEYFAELFHLNSEFIINKALKIDNSMSIFVDRYSHSLFLNYYFSTGKFDVAESKILAEVLTSRAFYEGLRYQYLSSIKYNKSKELTKDGKEI